MHGYKALNRDWTCRGKAYKAGETYTEDGSPVLCEHGMHFCPNLIDVFHYYECDETKTVVAEVEAVGDIAEGPDKCCTNKLRIIREVPWNEFRKTIDEASYCHSISTLLKTTVILNIAFILFISMSTYSRRHELVNILSLIRFVTIVFTIYDINQYRTKIIGSKLKISEIVYQIIATVSMLIWFLKTAG